MTTPVILPSKQFTKKTDARTFFKEILHSYQPDVDLSDEHKQLVIELIQTYYHTPTDKIGVGVERVFVNKSPKEEDPTQSTSCFYIERTDGTTINFGHDKCLKNISKP